MATLLKRTTDTIIYGHKLKGSKPVVGAYAVLYDTTTSTLLDQTTTDIYGYWELIISTATPGPGVYQIRFYGSGLKADLPPNGDWETVTVGAAGSGETIKIQASSLTVKQRADGSTEPTTVSGIQLLTIVQNGSVPTYKWYKNSVDTGITTSSYNITGANFPTTKDTYTVELYDPYLVTSDTVTITRLIDGDATLTAILSNEAHSVTSDTDGTPFSGQLGISGTAQTKVYVYVGISGLIATGGTPVQGQFKITNLAVDGVTASINTSTYEDVYIDTFPAGTDTGYVDITIQTIVGSTTLQVVKRFSLSKAKRGLQGEASGVPGPSLVYTGAWNSSREYIATSGLVEAVRAPDSYYYYAKLTHTNHEPPNSTYWTYFSQQFSSVATDLLLAQDVAVGRSITLGTDSPDAGASGLLRSAGADTFYSGDGFYLSATEDGTGLFRIGDVNGTSLVKGIAWDGPNNTFEIKAQNFSVDTNGNLTATNATIEGVITAASGLIGGFAIGATNLSSIPGVGKYVAFASSGDYAIQIGSTPSNTYFSVEHDGTLFATRGAIASWNITAEYFYTNEGWGSGMAPADFPFWSGASRILRDTAPFRVDSSGAIYSVSGIIGGWALSPGYFYSSSGSGAGMSPVDYPFFSGTTYANRASAPFRVTPEGHLTAQSGNIGAWTISSTMLYTLNGYGAGMAPSDYPFFAGVHQAIRETAPFRVTNTGAIYAVSGLIASWALSDQYLTANGGTIRTGSSGTYVTLNSTSFQTSTFESGNQGFRILATTGDAEFNNLVARGTLRASVFAIDEMSATGGTLVVTDSAEVVSGLTTPNDTTTAWNLCVRRTYEGQGAMFGGTTDENHVVRLKFATLAGITDIWAKRTTDAAVLGSGLADGGSYWRFSVKNATAGSQAQVIPKGVPAIGYGTSTAKKILLTSDLGGSSVTPYIDMFTVGSTPWNGVTSNLRLGNLAGITSSDYGALTGYGLYADNVFLKGAIVSVSGLIGGWSLGATSLSGGSATLSSTGVLTLGTGNDVVILNSTDGTYRLWIGNTTAASAPFRVTKAGVLTATGATITGTITATLGAIGGWTVGATTLTGGNATLDSTGVLTLGTGNNIVIVSAVDGTYRLWIGNATAGSAPFRVTAAGALTSTSGAIGGWTIGATTLTGGNATLGSTGVLTLGTGDSVIIASAVDGTYRLWVGNATAASAPFRVAADGSLTATNATITGSITSTTGTIGGFTIGANSLTGTNIGLHSSGYAESGEFLLGHATAYASAKIGLKQDGSGKLASGNFYWDTSGNVTMAGTFTSTATITGGTVQTSSGTKKIMITSATNELTFTEGGTVVLTIGSDVEALGVPGIYTPGGIISVQRIRAQYNSDGAIPIFGKAKDSISSNTYGVWGEVQTLGGTTGAAIGIYGTAYGLGSSAKWAGYFDSGNVLVNNILYFGGGAGATDTNLYRSAANVLTTDDNLVVGGGTLYLTANTSIYALTADIIRTPESLIVDGGLTVDTPTFAVNASTNSVGIGRTDPGTNLEVYGTDAEVMVHYASNARGGLRALASQRVGFMSTASADDLVFGWEDGHKGAFTEVARIDNGAAFLLVTGEIRATGDVVAYYSDARLKDNIQPLENALKRLLSIRGVAFDWNDRAVVGRRGKRDVGLIAQEVQQILPEAVTEPWSIGEDEAYQSVLYDKLIPLIIEAIRELKEKVDG